MNKVFRFELRKGNGLVDIHLSEVIGAGVIFAVTVFVCLVVHWALGVLFFVLSGCSMYGHRKLDNGRPEHLALLLRRLRPPVWNLCERDYEFRRLRNWPDDK